MLKLKLQYFGHLIWRASSLEKTLMVGKIEGRRRRRWQRMRCLDGIPDSVDMNLSQLREVVKIREAWRAVVHGVTKSWAWLSNWTVTLQKPWEKQAIFFLMRLLLCFVFWLVWVLVTVLSLFLVVVSGDNSSVICGLLIAVASCCRAQAPGCAGFSSCSSQAIEPVGSVVVVHGLNCSLACDIFPNPCSLRWQADS